MAKVLGLRYNHPASNAWGNLSYQNLSSL
uniref:Uncharacterized protein n=1 Tax=Arundo donax TaxID=35708 RepID=A0A0A8ZCJ1_ARUDO